MRLSNRLPDFARGQICANDMATNGAAMLSLMAMNRSVSRFRILQLRLGIAWRGRSGV